MSFKNLRDEFDPYVSAERRGWHARPIRRNRQATLDELSEVSDYALLELVRRSLKRDVAAMGEVVDLILEPPKRLYNVADRLLTGRMAEEFFVERAEDIVGHRAEELRDVRQLACGYDFGVLSRPEIAIEVKGLRRTTGSIMFTDHEWSEAAVRRIDYWVVVVGNLADTPRPKVYRDPLSTLEARCDYVRTATAVWRAKASV